MGTVRVELVSQSPPGQVASLVKFVPVCIPFLIALVLSSIFLVYWKIAPLDAEVASLFIGGATFALYGPLLLRLGRPIQYGWLAGVAAYGLAFPFWGIVIGVPTAIVGGALAWPQGLMTAALLGWLSGSRGLGVAVSVAIAPAWVIAELTIRLLVCLQGRGIIAANWRSFDAQDATYIFPLAVMWWNVSVSTALGLWVLHQWGQRNLQARRICISCGYDLRDLPEPICPECGTHASGPPLAAS